MEGSHRVTEDAAEDLEQLPTPISPTSEDIDLGLRQQLQGGRRVQAGKWAGRLRPRTFLRRQCRGRREGYGSGDAV